MTRRQRRSDDGVTLLIFALCMVALLTVVALAVDLGNARAQRRNNQQLTDLSSLAAGRHLAGFVTPDGATVVSNPYGACAAAIQSIQTNAGDFRPELSDLQIQQACQVFYNPFPPPTGGTACTPSTSPLEIVPIERGPYTLRIRYPIPDSEIQDLRLTGGAGTADGDDQCERMRISVDRVDKNSFATVIGIAEQQTSGRSVIRADLGAGSDAIPSFLLLERVNCGVLGNSVGGSSLGIVVEQADGEPGFIHVDSVAANSGCANNTNQANGVAVWAPPLPSGDTSLTIEGAGDAPGVLAVVASQPRALGGGGSEPSSPTPAAVVSRQPVDDTYNSAANSFAINALHSRGYAEVSSSANLGSGTNGWLTLNCNLLPNSGDLADLLATNWYVNCNNYSPASASSFTAPLHGAVSPQRIVFSGNVSVGTTATLDIGNAVDLTVRGELDVSGRGILSNAKRIYIGNGLSASGDISVGTTSLPTISGDAVNTVCPAQTAAGNSREMVVFFNGTTPSGTAMSISGNAAFCSTTVYLAGPNQSSNSSYSRSSDTTTAAYQCSPTLPCPSLNSSNARFSLAGNNKAVEWTAPNETSADPGPARGLEDLMLWSEAGRDHSVGSNARLVSSGVLFAPNSRVSISSPVSASPRNAQFIARQLFLSMGTLKMRPLPNDSVPVPAPGTFALIR